MDLYNYILLGEGINNMFFAVTKFGKNALYKKIKFTELIRKLFFYTDEFNCGENYRIDFYISSRFVISKNVKWIAQEDREQCIQHRLLKTL
jgi:hypothetical protein